MDDLIAFLRARLDDDEQAACATVPGPWVWTAEEDVWGQCGPTLVHNPGDDEAEVLAGWGHDAWGVNVADGAAAHIARHDPARVLAEVDVKRRIIDLHEAADYEYADGPVCLSCDQGGPLPYPCPTLRLLALPYADHPDYQDTWRP